MELARIRWRLAAVGLVIALVVAAGLVWRRAGGVPQGDMASAAPRGIIVEVRNGTNRAGLGRQVARLLRENGIDVVAVGTSTTRTDSTTILVRRGDMARGHEIARLLGGAAVRAGPDSLPRVDLTILLGANYRLPKGRVPL